MILRSSGVPLYAGILSDHVSAHVDETTVAPAALAAAIGAT